MAMVNAHFRPVNELLQWLQCLSSESSIDGLLATMQNLSTLNPLQMRRAMREYRYEVDETKISEECSQYLAQLQKDWERRRLLQGLDNAAREAERRASTSTGSSTLDDRDGSSSVSLHSNESSRTSDPRSLVDNPTHEALAGYKWDITAYEVPERPPCFDELLDSRLIVRTYDGENQVREADRYTSFPSCHLLWTTLFSTSALPSALSALFRVRVQHLRKVVR